MKAQESSEVFKQRILEEHCLSCFGSYLRYWGVEAMGEVGGKKDKRK